MKGEPVCRRFADGSRHRLSDRDPLLGGSLLAARRDLRRFTANGQQRRTLELIAQIQL
jgi:hypothetical protein